MKPILAGEYTKMYDDLLFVADCLKATDPCGAQLIRQAAHMLVRAGCLRCRNEYGRGYTAGYKAGSSEWQELGAAQTPPAKEQI